MKMEFDNSVCYFYCTKSHQNAALVRAAERSTLSEEEKKMCEFFKCGIIDRMTKKFIDCPFSTNKRPEFTEHMKTSHKASSFICIYCSHLDKVALAKKFDNPSSLMHHMDKHHLNRIYQCNMCSYRALTCDQVNVHLALKHTSQPFELKKIMTCVNPRGITKSELRLREFYDKYRVKNESIGLNRFQCLYCKFSSEALMDTVSHLSSEHADFPMLYYIPSTSASRHILQTNEAHQSSIDEILLTSDEEEALQYCCFFCDSAFSSSDAAKCHMKNHLVYSPNEQLDSFLTNWLNWFVAMQHQYYGSKDASERYSMCALCRKLTIDSDSSLHSDGNLPIERQKIHYILHSCYKPFKCQLCVRDKKGEFWLPNIMRRILNHLTEYHRVHLEADKDLRSYNLHSKRLNFSDWPTVKQLLQERDFILEYHSKNPKIRYSLSFENQQALQLLETTYRKYLQEFGIFHNGNYISAAAGKKLKSSQPNLLTDDEGDH